MNYAGKLWSEDVYVGVVYANSMRGLTRRASVLCNRYNRELDTMVLHRAEGKEVFGLKYTRENKLSADNKVIRGKWK